MHVRSHDYRVWQIEPCHRLDEEARRYSSAIGLLVQRLCNNDTGLAFYKDIHRSERVNRSCLKSIKYTLPERVS